jgi:Uri superfamily endonuclease
MVVKGVYLLVINLKKNSKIKIGKLGKIAFPKGFYVYVGSALNNLQARVARHLSSKKKLRWHIDYLLASPNAEVEMVITRQTEKRIECEVNEIIQKFGKPVEKFGSSDCKCKSHLTYFKSLDDIKKAFEELNSRQVETV